MQDIQKTTTQVTQARNYTVKEACTALNISHAHFYNLVRRGQINPIKLGRKTLIPIWQVDKIVGGGSA